MVDAAALVVTGIVKEKNRLIRSVPEMNAVSGIMTVTEKGVVLEIVTVVTVTIAIETEIEITEKETEVVIAKKKLAKTKKVAKIQPKKLMSVEIEEIENVTVTEDIVETVIKMAAIMIDVITVVVVTVIEDVETIEKEGMIFKVDEVEAECVVEAVVEDQAVAEDLIEVEEEEHGLVVVVITCIEVAMILIEIIEVVLIAFVGVAVDEVDQDKLHGVEFPQEEEEDQDFHMGNTHHRMLLANIPHHRQVLLDINNPLHLDTCNNPIPQIPSHHKCQLA